MYFGVQNATYSGLKLDGIFGYNKGHMAARANHKKKGMIKTTFILENSIPQNKPDNGSGAWVNFEHYGRALANSKKTCDKVDIISGPIYYSGIKHKDKDGQDGIVFLI